MIGKMYRPLKVLNIREKRGFTIVNKYKSNFGGTHTFDMDMYLDYNAETETEVIHIEFKGINIPVYVQEGARKNDVIVVQEEKERVIKSLRKMVRPTKISSKDMLEMTILIESPKVESENDALEIKLMPIVKNGEEFLQVQARCKTPVLIHADVPLTTKE
jgi:hypothetical protein